jgi:hypothetical protein
MTEKKEKIKMLLSDTILDAALALIEATSPTLVTKLYVVEAGDSELCAAVTIDGSNFTGPADNAGSGGGRKLTFATSGSQPLTAVAIDASGSATKISLTTAGSTIQVQADITGGAKAVSASDTVSIGSFEIIFKDAA